MLSFIKNFLQKRLLQNTSRFFVTLQVKILARLSRKYIQYAEIGSEREAKLLAGTIVNILFNNSMVSDEQEKFYSENKQFIYKEITKLKEIEPEICEAVRQATVIAVVLKMLHGKGENALKKPYDALNNLSAKLNTNDAKDMLVSISCLKDLGLIGDDWDKPVNPVEFIAMVKRF